MIRGTKTYRFFTDQLGSVRMVVDVGESNASDAVVQQASYGPWGVRTFVKGATFDQPFGYAGGLHDKETGLVHFGAREYEPLTGRWMTKDPIRFGGGDTNLYAYVAGDPMNYVDPSGTEKWAIVRRLFEGTQAAGLKLVRWVEREAAVEASVAGRDVATDSGKAADEAGKEVSRRCGGNGSVTTTRKGGHGDGTEAHVHPNYNGDQGPQHIFFGYQIFDALEMFLPFFVIDGTFDPNFGRPTVGDPM